MTKKDNKKIAKRKVRQQEKQIDAGTPSRDVTLGRAGRRCWGGGKAKK